MEKVANLSRVKKALAIVAVILLSLLALIITLRVAYFGRVYPGVTANGVYLGGLKPDDALKELNTLTNNYSSKQIEVATESGNKQLSAQDFGVNYDNNKALAEAIQVGRSGWFLQKAISQIKSLLGLEKPIVAINFDVKQLSNTAVGLNGSLVSPTENAKFVSENGIVVVQESKVGQRLDFGLLPTTLESEYGNLKTTALNLPILGVNPQISSSVLESQKNLVSPFQSQPLVLSYGSKNWSVDINGIVGWLVLPTLTKPYNNNLLVNGYYNLHQDNNSLYFDKKAVTNYLSGLAAEINVEPVNATLDIADGRATVFAQSRDGKTLDVNASADAILNALSSASNTPISLVVITTKAEVSNDNIEKLGIKELISEGITYFPGSPSNRMQNVRVGASKFNGVIIRPGENFSFNDHLGEVGPEQGYASGLVILNDHEEKQYGGGLCQVSSTAYRAALLAGLPITERVNHAFAVDYYTAPYGIPGVDATIYLPQPDMRFINDTGHYILIQTHLEGTTLRFDFYGTKTKSGVIRGPFFVTGSLDATQPSQTVFYRDILDLNGKVVKTDTVNTFYKSSLQFPLGTN